MANVKRDLCGVYFRIKRDDKMTNVCFSDMTDEEMDAILGEKGMTIDFAKGLAKRLGQVIREIGNELDLCME